MDDTRFYYLGRGRSSVRSEAQMVILGGARFTIHNMIGRTPKSSLPPITREHNSHKFPL